MPRRPWRVAGVAGVVALPPALVAVLLDSCAVAVAVLLLLLGAGVCLHWIHRAQLNARAHSFRELVESVEAILWEAAPETFRISFLSHSAERLLGYPRERWLEEEDFWEQHLHPDDREQTVSEA